MTQTIQSERKPTMDPRITPTGHGRHHPPTGGTKRWGATLAAIITAAATLLGTAATATAAETRVTPADLAKPQPLTVEAQTDISNRQLRAIPLAYYSYAAYDSGRITSFDVADASHASSIDKELKAAGIDPTQGSDDKATTYDAANPMAWVVHDLLDSTTSPWAGKLRDLLDHMKRNTWIVDKNAHGVDDGTMLTPVAGDNHRQSADLKPGVYLIVDKTGTGQASIAMMQGTGINGMTTLQGSQADAASYTLGTVEYKTHTVTVSKTITAVDGHGTVSADGMNAATQIGGTITMRLTSRVPNWTGYDRYYYALNDTYSAGLKLLDVQSVSVDGKQLTEGDEWRMTSDTANRKFIIRFGDANNDIVAMKNKFPVDAPVTVTYRMKMTGNATAGTAGTNSVEAEHSHNPNDWTQHETVPGNTVKVHTGRVDIRKTDMGGQPLAGARFELLDAGSDTPRWVVKTADGAYRLAENGENGAVQVMDVKQDGTLRIDGLSTTDATDTNGYRLKETKSPYNNPLLPQTMLHVTVNPTDGTWTVGKGAGDVNNMITVADNLVTVKNARNHMEMPKTGATWLMIWTVGCLTAAAGGMLLIHRSRRRD